MALRTHLLLSIFHARISGQFTCMAGLDCKLSLFDYGLPAVPSLRVSNAACGASSVTSVVAVTGPPVPEFDLGRVPNLVGDTATLHICLADNSVPDPNYSTSFGTVDVVAPTVFLAATCYSGTECRITLTGNKLSDTDGMLFYSAEDDCSTGPSAAMLGLGNSAARLSFPSTSSTFTYSSFGVVDPLVTAPQTADLCWAASSHSGESTYLKIGSLTLRGPATRNARFICYLGTECAFAYTDGDPNSLFIISDSGTSCLRSSSGVTWLGTTSVSVYNAATSEYSFGTSIRPNSLAVDFYVLCWKQSINVAHFLVNVGVLSMVGPSSLGDAYTCVSGMSCDVTIAGVFNNAFTHQLSVRTPNAVGSTDCSVATLFDLKSLQDNPTVKSLPSASASSITFEIGHMGVPAQTNMNYLLCWQSSKTGSVPVASGTLRIYGPESLVDALECVLGESCVLAVILLLPANFQIPSQELLFVTYVTSTDPCALTDADVVTLFAVPGQFDSNVGSTTFTVPSVNKGNDPAIPVSRTLCWRLTGASGTRAVPIGAWTLVGPSAGLSVPSYLGSSCSVTLSATDDETRLFVTDSDSDCDKASPGTSLPQIRGMSSAGSRVAATTQYSFGIPEGWILPVNNAQRILTICYSRRQSLRKSTILGHITLIRTVGIDTNLMSNSPSCTTGSDCTVTLAGSGIEANAKLFISSSVACDSSVNFAVLGAHALSATSSGAAWQVFTVPAALGFAGTGYGCYELNSGILLNVGQISFVGFSPAASATCIKGRSVCSISIAVTGSLPATFSTFISSDGCVSTLSVVTRSGSSVLTWSVSGTFLSASVGISRALGASVSDCDVCYKPVAAAPDAPVKIGSVKLLGPHETNSATCLAGAECAIDLQGSFDHESVIAFAAYVDLSINTNSNPCSNLVSLPGLSTVPESETVLGRFIVPPIGITSDVPQFTMCWRSSKSVGDYVFVPAGVVSFTGPSSSDSLACTTGSPCSLTVSLTGLNFPLVTSVATLAQGTSCLGSNFAMIVPAHIETITVASGATAASQEFNFGVISDWDENTPISLCWGAYAGTGLADAPVRIGALSLTRPKCDSVLFPHSALNIAAIKAGIIDGSLNPNCQVVFTNSPGTHVSQSLLRFSIEYLGTALVVPEILDILIDFASISVGSRNTGGESILMTAVRNNISFGRIKNILGKGMVVELTEINSAISTGRDDVCSLLVERLSLTELKSVLSSAVAAKLTDCVAKIMQRGVSLTNTLALHESVQTDQSDLFRILLRNCCPASVCLDSNRDSNGKTVRDLVNDHQATYIDGDNVDLSDPFSVAIQDARDCYR